MKRTPPKQKILTVLKKDHEITIDEMMEYFTISEVAVRRHINDLEKQGLVQKNTMKQKIGRPYFTYELTKKGHQTFPNQFEQLPVEILHDLEAIHGEEAVSEVLSRRMERDRQDFESKLQTEDFDEKIAQVAQIQDEKGYMVEFEKLENGDYEMKHYNCPISNIAHYYKQVCRNEKNVFDEIFPQSEVISHSCITDGDSYCKWVIKKPEGAIHNSND